MTDPLLRTCEHCGGKLPSGDFRTHQCPSPLPAIPAGAALQLVMPATTPKIRQRKRRRRR